MKKPKPNPKPLARVESERVSDMIFYTILIGDLPMSSTTGKKTAELECAAINSAAENWYKRRTKEKPWPTIRK